MGGRARLAERLSRQEAEIRPLSCPAGRPGQDPQEQAQHERDLLHRQDLEPRRAQGARSACELAASPYACRWEEVLTPLPFWTSQKPRRPSAQGPSITCFTITINSKSYLWETESGRQQDDFLVTLVRAYRQCTGGASPRLTGFQVGEIPGAPPAYEVPVPGQGGQYASGSMASPNRLPPPSASSASMNNRPGTANSTMSNESSFYAQQQQQHQQQLSPADPIAGGVTSPSATSPLSPAALAMRKKASNSSMNSVGSASSSVRPNARPPLPSGGPRPTQQPQILSSPSKSAVPPSSRSGTPTPTSRQDGHYPSSAQQQGSYGSAQPSLTVSSGSPRPRVRDLEPSQATSSPPRKLSVPTSTADETNRPLDSTAAANAALLLLGQGGSQRKNSTASSTGRGGGAEGNEDSDIMLTNVEEMLEGIEWGNSGQNGHGQSQGQHSADMIEKRLLGELNALEAVRPLSCAAEAVVTGLIASIAETPSTSRLGYTPSSRVMTGSTTSSSTSTVRSQSSTGWTRCSASTRRIST